MEAPGQTRYCFGPFVLDPAERVLLREGCHLPLPPKALETLLALAEKPGHVIEKSELLRRVWPDTYVGEATLAQNIFTLRKVLNHLGDGHEYIETIPKRGYRFVAPVETKGEPISVGRRSLRTPLRRPIPWAAWASLILVVALGIYVRWRGRRLPADPAIGKVMLAVLPFENLSGDARQDYFSDGLTEEMIAELSRIDPDRLRVIARTSAMQYKGTAKTVAQIGRELGVNYILESSIRREGSRVRVTTQLVRVSDQIHLWSQSYERDMQGVLTLQEEIAGDVAAQIAIKLGSGASGQPATISNLDSYEDYLKGRYFWNKRSEQGYLKAIEYFQQAIAEDPGYAQAYSGLADTFALLGSNPTTPITRQEAIARARAAALKALSLDDTLAEAHTSLAFVYWHYDWNWSAAEKEFQRALQLNPSYPTAHHWYAFYLVSQGQMDKALEEIRRAQGIDPLSLIINTDVAQLLYFAQRYDQAIEQAKRVLEMDPEFALAREMLAWSYLGKQQYEAALEQIKAGMRIPGAKSYFEANLSATYALMGQKAQAKDILRKIEALSEQKHTSQLYVGIAEVHAALGETDQAFAWLEKDVRNRDGGLTLIQVLPYFNSLHEDTRFKDLVRRIGLPPQNIRAAVSSACSMTGSRLL